MKNKSVMIAAAILALILLGSISIAHADDDDEENTIPVKQWVAKVDGHQVVTIDPKIQSLNGIVIEPLPASGVPDSAIIWWNGTQWIYLEKSPGQFTRAPLSIGLTSQDHIVTTGAQQLFSEEFRSQIEVGEEEH